MHLRIDEIQYSPTSIIQTSRASLHTTVLYDSSFFHEGTFIILLLHRPHLTHHI